MNFFEKIYSILAVIVAAALIAALVLVPELRYPEKLLPLCTVGLLINIGLMFVILRDIFSRRFSSLGQKYLWLAMILLFWPSVLIYLPKHGFKPRFI